jgi:uncharacterized membrane protein
LLHQGCQRRLAGLEVRIEVGELGNVQSTSASISTGLSTDAQTESLEIQTVSASVKIKPGHSGAVHLHPKIPSTVAAGAYHMYITITADGDTTTVIGPAFTVKP